MKIFMIVAFVFTLLSTLMAAAAAVFAAFWSISNIASFGIAGDYATLGMLAAIAGTGTSLVAMIMTALPMLSKSAPKIAPMVALILIVVTFIIAVSTAVLSPLWMAGDVVKYGIVSTMPLAGFALGILVGAMSLMALIMMIVDRVVKPSVGSA
jgi:hypothetical protein